MTGLNQQKAFTLIEVLTVMLVLVAVASVTVQTASTLAFQGRDEVTKDRYAKIKAAILGNPNIVVNGQPDISGFVADVGRLPFALQELLDGNHCPDTSYWTPLTCDTALGAGSWIATPNWHGPYISSTQSATGTSALSDGWGNTGSGNYGWIVTYFDNTGIATTNISSAVSMNIQSKGKDQQPGGTALYDVDYPSIQPSIRQQDWQVNINNISAMIMASSITGSCTIATPPSIPADCNLTGRTWNPLVTPPCVGVSVPNSKLGCESVGGSWGYGAPTNLCIKIIRNSTPYISNPHQPITEDGREHPISFPIANVPAGQAIGMIFTDTDTDALCNTNPPSSTYLSANQVSICINTNNHANFTQANCENVVNNGIWIDDGVERHCDGVIGNACTDTTGTNLGGTAHPKFQITLIPHTTLPIINW